MILTPGSVVRYSRLVLGWTRIRLADESGHHRNTIMNIEDNKLGYNLRAMVDCLRVMGLDPEKLKEYREGKTNPALEQAMAIFPEEIVQYVVEHDFPVREKEPVLVEGAPKVAKLADKAPDLPVVPNPWAPDVNQSGAWYPLYIKSTPLDLPDKGLRFNVLAKYLPEMEYTFALPLRGKKMEPALPDGSLLYVMEGDALRPGDKGVFLLTDGELVCRKSRPRGLLSLADVDIDVPWTRVARTLGRVTGFCPPGCWFSAPFCRA